MFPVPAGGRLPPEGIEGAVLAPPPRGGAVVWTPVLPLRGGEAAGGPVFAGWRVVPRGGVAVPPARLDPTGAGDTPTTRPGVSVRPRLDEASRG
ncbi:hypothetical protein [Frankia gtarii]|uniref:hypothetical protein n=1 Tax=Frankia gtarii TaxID=2950102 RepID=UPI0021BECFB0|nr:hypothetical protein [Frankia gtarii]